MISHEGDVNAVTFSPDGKCIASASHDGTIRLWNADSGQLLGEPFRGHSDKVFSVEFSSDGRRIVSGSHDATIRLWDTETHQAMGTPLTVGKGSVYSAAFSPDDSYIVWALNLKENGSSVAMPVSAEKVEWRLVHSES